MDADPCRAGTPQKSCKSEGALPKSLSQFGPLSDSFKFLHFPIFLASNINFKVKMFAPVHSATNKRIPVLSGQTDEDSHHF